MKGFCVLALLVLHLSFFALGTTKVCDEYESDEDGKSSDEDMSTRPKKKCDGKKESESGGRRNPGENSPITSPTSRATTEPSSASLWSRPALGTTGMSPSPALTRRSAIGTAAEPPPSPAPLSSRVAIFVPVAIFLFLLLLFAAFLLWKYSHYFLCWRRLGGKDEGTVKMKPENNEVTILPPVSHPPASEDQAQLPPSGHFYQEISDVRMGVPGPDASYSTVGFPYHDQKAADKQPPDGQYSLLGLASQ
ncbi:uncharacterized protein LOC143793648 [Ranitomeya variabilis]|uniref:uncharacterized protein LOC143793648 n=1 Tax=Ranitomeya variabilis TaxID=490064 RepID=UPI0040566BE6